MTDPQQQENSETLQKLQEKFNEILSGVHIDESTFQINWNERTNEERDIKDKGSVAFLIGVVKELRDLKESAGTKFEFRDSVSSKIDFLLYDICTQLSDGSYFSSIDDVWDSTLQKCFDKIDVTLFDRTPNSPIYETYQNYKITAEGAIVVTNIEAAGTSTSTMSSSTMPAAQDVFGYVEHGSESDHLLPHSPNCSPLWYPFVPWVLFRLKITDPELLQWKFFQKSIQGFKLNPQSNRVAGVGIKQLHYIQYHPNS